jgi:alpha-N-arabinofuranosidase
MTPGGKRVPIALDEWAMWLPKEIPAYASPRPPAGLGKPADIGLYGPVLTLRDALAEAAVYNLMQRRPDDFALANRTLLYAYALGMIAIGRDRVAVSPPGLMLELSATHDRCRSLRNEVRGPTFDLPARDGFSAVKGADYLDVSARLRPDGKTVELFVVNRDVRYAIDATVSWHGGSATGSADLAVLNSTSLREWNSFEDPHRVCVETAQERLTDGRLRHRFPAHSLTRVTVQVPKD